MVGACNDPLPFLNDRCGNNHTPHSESKGTGPHRQAGRRVSRLRRRRLSNGFPHRRRGLRVSFVPGMPSERSRHFRAVRQSARQGAYATRLHEHQVREGEETEGSDQTTHGTKVATQRAARKTGFWTSRESASTDAAPRVGFHVRQVGRRLGAHRVGFVAPLQLPAPSEYGN